MTLDAGYKVVSGGGRLVSGDILMAETYPSSDTTWTTTLSQHGTGNNGQIAAYALGLYDPSDEWEVVIVSDESASSDNPSTSATISAGFLLTGGGARVSSTDSGLGLLLFGSYPSGNDTWEAVGHQHISAGTGKVMAYAIGARHRTSNCPFTCDIESQVSASDKHPTTTVTLGYPGILGGGAMGTLPTDSNDLAGNILTILAPSADGMSWEAKAKDHAIAQTGTVTAYTIECPVGSLELTMATTSTTSTTTTTTATLPSCTPPTMQLKIFSLQTSVAAGYQTLTMTVDTDYKIISGGGQMLSGDILMTETYPENETSWTATLSQHDSSTTGNIAVYAVGLYDPSDDWDVVITDDESTSGSSSSVTASVPSGYQMTGGGARVSATDSGAGVLLFGSYPSDGTNWRALGHQHKAVGTGKVTAYAIGVKHRTEVVCPMSCIIVSELSSTTAHPTVTITRSNADIVGGGGLGTLPTDANSLAGNILVSTAPLTDGTTWMAKAKDHKISHPGQVRAYAVVCPAASVNYI